MGQEPRRKGQWVVGGGGVGEERVGSGFPEGDRN